MPRIYCVHNIIKINACDLATKMKLTEFAFYWYDVFLYSYNLVWLIENVGGFN